MFLATCITFSAHAELFISEYVEGTSYNKAVEIFNSGTSPVSLSNYSLKLYSNGASSPSSSMTLSGTISPNQALVACHNSADQTIKSAATFISSTVINFNGDDAVALFNGSAIVDVFGRIGYDPGSYWGSGGTTTQDHTLRRKSSVTTGDPIGSNPFVPIIEWDFYAVNTFDGLGSHTIDGGGNTIPIASNPIPSSQVLSISPPMYNCLSLEQIRI